MENANVREKNRENCQLAEEKSGKMPVLGKKSERDKNIARDSKHSRLLNGTYYDGLRISQTTSSRSNLNFLRENGFICLGKFQCLIRSLKHPPGMMKLTVLRDRSIMTAS